MDDTQSMLRTIINNQSHFRQELLSKLDQVERKLTMRMNSIELRMTSLEENLSARIDKLGKQLAYLEDDTPTREEFEDLEGRVDKLEQKSTTSN